jgi:hypothetical protein
MCIQREIDAQLALPKVYEAPQTPETTNDYCRYNSDSLYEL